MKKLLILVLSLILTLSLIACGGDESPAPSDNSTPAASRQEPASSTPSKAEPSSAEASTPEAAPGEVVDFDIGIAAVPAEWQKAIGTSMYGMNTGAGDDYSDSYLNKFGSVSADDYAKLIAYFDTLSYTEKLDGVYNCDWGQLQIGHNTGASEMTITWYAN